MTDDNLRRFIDCAKTAGLRPVIPVEIEALARPDVIEQWHREKGMLAFGLRGADLMAPVIDVLLKPGIPFPELRRDAKLIAVGLLTVPMASIEHLIAMKTGTGRSKDAIDIEELQQAAGWNEAMNAEQNYRLLQEIDANRRFLLTAYRDNPDLLARTEPEIRRLFEPAPTDAAEAATSRRAASADS